MMEFDDIVVKDSPGLCRCCLSEGCYKDMATEYSWMDETEVYADMLLECFDISISQHMDGPNGPNRLICEVCITRLRDACNFKKQVLDSEKKFVDMVGRGEFTSKVMVYQPAMKEEGVTVEPDLDDGVPEYLDDDMHFDDTDDEPLKPRNSTHTQASGSEGITISELKIKPKKGRPKKTDKAVKRPKKEEKPKKAVAKSSAEALPTESTISRNRKIKKNVALILENSTAIPFLLHKGSYLCFICRMDFKEFAPLFEHTTKSHNVKSILSSFSTLGRDIDVKINITNLACRICDGKLEDVQSLVDHLKKAHRKVFNDDYEYGVVPYRISGKDYQCGLCEERFEYFINLNKHMNEHFEKLVCDYCGKAFLNRNRLRHHYLIHVPQYRCSVCDETFSSSLKRDMHETAMHELDKTIKCTHPGCNESFDNYNRRKKHLDLAHGEKVTNFDCPGCDRRFYAESRMRTHVRQVHEKEKNCACEWCGKKFFSISMVRRHVQKHCIYREVAQKKALEIRIEMKKSP